MQDNNLPSLSAALINDDVVDKPVRLLCEAGFYTASLSLMNSMLGAGILAYPYAYMSSGTLVGTILALTIGCLSFMAINVIFKLMAIATASDESLEVEPLKVYRDITPPDQQDATIDASHAAARTRASGEARPRATVARSTKPMPSSVWRLWTARMGL